MSTVTKKFVTVDLSDVHLCNFGNLGTNCAQAFLSPAPRSGGGRGIGVASDVRPHFRFRSRTL